ncbi:MAG: sporulation protein YqfD [Clostridiales bacterium]|nr:sporulation protein YqfD [Clostridiales bacterium]
MFLIHFLRWLFGFVRWEAEGGFPERLLNLASRQHIRLWGVERHGTFLSACCFARSYRRMRPLSRKSGMRMRLKQKQGIPFFLHRYRARAGIAAGLAVYFLLLQLLSQRIWVIDVSGNERVPEKAILDVVEQMGVVQGGDGEQLDIPTIQLAALQQLPDLAWLTVNLEGSTAHVEVSERIPTPELEDPNRPSNIKAARDGRIIRMEVTGGQAVAQTGDAVVKDMLLVSGVVDNASGAVLKRSRARILAQTRRELIVEVPLAETRLLPTGRTVYRPTLQLFGLKIPLYTDGPIDGEFILTEEAHPLTSGHIRLPVGFSDRLYTLLAPREVIYTEEEAAALAQSQLNERVRAELTGVEIQSSSQSERVENGVYILTGLYDCIEDIAVEEQLLISGK